MYHKKLAHISRFQDNIVSMYRLHQEFRPMISSSPSSSMRSAVRYGSAHADSLMSGHDGPTALFRGKMVRAGLCRQRYGAWPVRSSAGHDAWLAKQRGFGAGRKSLSRLDKVNATSADAAVEVIGHKELPKNFNPGESEEKLYAWWEREGYFKPDKNADGKPFVMSMPPPNVTGKLHMGHAMFVTLQDIMARFHRMRGRPTLWLPGTDHAGIATQMVVEKMLSAEGKNRREMGREKFEAEVWNWKAQYGGFITEQLRRLGASCDWSKERFTLDDGLSVAVAEAFVRLHEKGLVYRGSYLVNWDPKLQTAVSDLEVEYSEEPGTLYYFRYPIAGGGPEDYLPIATTRPETILGDTAVAVHPEDSRYKHLIGKEAEVPLSNGRRIPIIGDEYVDREFGTGALKITPGHDVNDYELGKRHSLPVINIMNDDGTLNSSTGKYAGKDRLDVRKLLWNDMKAAGLVLKEESHQSRIPRSQRGGEIVEPLVREQWFVRMESLAKPALEAVDNGTVKIVPERFERTYRQWLENIRDWCVSRQLWWGHRIPVWYVFESEEEANEKKFSSKNYVVARNESEAIRLAHEKYGPGAVLRQESDVLDTWFSSSLWPFSTLGWPDETSEDISRFYPTSVLETGHDILFFWVARMMMMGIELTGKAPFSTIYLHGLVRDEKGRKMSKSLGNVVDPVETIQQFGADALRYTLATGTSPGQDLNLSLDRVNGSRNFTNKVWNASKFVLFSLTQAGIVPGTREWEEISMTDFGESSSLDNLPLPERWIISRLHASIDAITSAQESFDFGEAGRILYEFFWSDFADWFIEASKSRLYSDNENLASTTRSVLVYVIDRTLRLSHPFLPFITEELWQAMPGAMHHPALINAPWPSTNLARDMVSEEYFELLQDTVRSIRNARAEYGVEPGRRIPARVCASSQKVLDALKQEADVLSLLAKLDADMLSFDNLCASDSGENKESTIELVVKEGLEAQLPLAGLFDAAKEIDRLEKQAAKLEKDLGALRGRLCNESFVSKAPAKVVEEVRMQEAEMSEQVAAVQEKIAKFKALTA